MTDQHPITPPPEQVQKWIEKYGNSEDPRWQTYEQDIATQAARWGADQELEACIKYFFEYDSSWGENSELITGLRAARRPQPKSLAEEALAALEQNIVLLMPITGHEKVKRFAVIRRALERLQELEGQG